MNCPLRVILFIFVVVIVYIPLFLETKNTKKKKREKVQKTLIHLQSMTSKMFVNSINNRQATITCITKTGAIDVSYMFFNSS